MTLYHTDAKELKDFYNSQKRIAAYSLKSDKSSGVIGTPKVDSDKFKKVIDLLENLESNLIPYARSIREALESDFTIDPSNPDKILRILIETKRALGGKSFSLDAIPFEDVEKFRSYFEFLEERTTTMKDIIDAIDEVVNRPINPVDMDLVKTVYNVVGDIYNELDYITDTMRFDIQRYDSGTVQPAKLGGFNLDKHLKYSDMYQTMPTRYL
jgi:hypothetical protein